MEVIISKRPPRDGLPYEDHEVNKLDRLAAAIDTPSEMEMIAPIYARMMGRSIGAIQHQIENRKRAAGHKEFFFRR